LGGGAEVTAWASLPAAHFVGDKVRAVFFGEEAMSLARTIHRGDKVALKGELVEKEYTNREGTPTKSLEVQKASMEVLDKGRSAVPSRDVEQGLG
jgi:single-stranded DNA-binding protein